MSTVAEKPGESDDQEQCDAIHAGPELGDRESGGQCDDGQHGADGRTGDPQWAAIRTRHIGTSELEHDVADHDEDVGEDGPEDGHVEQYGTDGDRTGGVV